MATPVSLSIGDNLLFNDLVTGWRAEAMDTNPPSVVLTASMQVGQTRSIFPAPYGETSAAVQMDGLVAIRLYEKLGDLIRSMGWQPLVEGGRPI
jgi:hypothetical protein